MKKIFRTKYMVVCLALFCLLVMAAVCLALSYKKVVFEYNPIWENASDEITVQFDNGKGYEITKETYVIDHDHFLPEYSTVEYPTIKFSDEATNDRLGEKINRIFRETAMLNYDVQLEQEINAFYACQYRIANADEDYISIFYWSTDGAGTGLDNIYFAVTVSLDDGDKVSLADFESADNIMHRLGNYRGTIYFGGTIYSDYDNDPNIWMENKEEFVTEWLEDEKSPLHGWYLRDGRIGFFFVYPRTSHINIALEFSNIVDD